MSRNANRRDPGQSAGVATRHRGGARKGGARGAIARLLPLGLVVVLSGACATKGDVRDLQTEIAMLRMQQDSLMAVIAEQNRSILDTLSANRELTLRVRGDLGHQLVGIEQQLIQIQELTGQSQRRLAELRDQMEARAQLLEQQPQATGDTAGAAMGGEADELYQIGMQQLQSGATRTARQAFEEIIESHATHPRAPDAQFQIGETYAMEEEYDQALQAFERVVELFPNSPRAANALYRAGVISAERGNMREARQYFERVVVGYPNSDVAGPAQEKLREMR